MFKKQRFAFLAIGGLGLLAAIAPGLAATLNVPDADGIAAGQGAVPVESFTISDIDWEIDNDGFVTVVSFDIVRDIVGREDVIAAADESTGNAVVRVRLETDSVGTTGSWVSCSVPSGGNRATCATSTSTPKVEASALDEVNFVAFDRTS